MRADNDNSIVAVFPLPRVVLMPGTTLPLHIFEPRYRAMTRDALTQNLFIALAQLATDKPSGDTPPIHPIAGVGEVVEATPLPDGRFNILLAGRYRARLEELPFQPPYRRAHAKRLEPCASNVARRGYHGPHPHRRSLRYPSGPKRRSAPDARTASERARRPRRSMCCALADRQRRAAARPRADRRGSPRPPRDGATRSTGPSAIVTRQANPQTGRAATPAFLYRCFLPDLAEFELRCWRPTRRPIGLLTPSK